MPSVNKIVCHGQLPNGCGQTINMREEVLTRGYVTALFHVMKWCIEKNRHEFTKQDIMHYLPKGGVVENFHKLRWFGLLYNPDAINGHYGMNIDRVKRFFAGEEEVIIKILVNPLSKDSGGGHEVIERGTIDKVPNIRKFQDEFGNLIVQYRTPQEPEQTGLDFGT